MKKKIALIISFFVCTLCIISLIVLRPVIIFDKNESEIAECVATNALDKRLDVSDYKLNYVEYYEDNTVYIGCDVKPINDVAAFDWSAVGRSENGWNIDCSCWAKYYNIGPVYFSYITFNSQEG